VPPAIPYSPSTAAAVWATVPKVIKRQLAIPKRAKDQVDELRGPAIAVLPTGVALLPAAEESGDLTLAEAETEAKRLDLARGHQSHMAGPGCFDEFVAFVGDQLLTGIRVNRDWHLDRNLAENTVAFVVRNIDEEIDDPMGFIHGDRQSLRAGKFGL
jgi:hypothetical protein